MNHIINAALQILPRSKDQDIYSLVDKAIGVIQNSGLKYKVCPFETVIEGKYDEVMKVISEAQKACLLAGASEYIAYIKLQVNNSKDVRIEDKIGKFETKNPVE
jgi:uncharacterized protein (TIGR00106 family)